MGDEVIVVIDDEERWLDRFRKILTRVLSTQVATVTSGADLLAVLADTENDVRVVLFDQALIGERGSDLVHQVRTELPNGKILLGVTSSTDPADVEAFREAGADGMASKAALRHGLADAIAVLMSGHRITEDEAALFEIPNGFIADWLVESRT